jgi:hypothetical protein
MGVMLNMLWNMRLHMSVSMPEEPGTVFFYHKWTSLSALNGLCRVCVVAECALSLRMAYR